MKRRLVGLDIFRILSAFVVFLFHTQMHMSADFGILNGFIQMGAIFMTGFFMLSGYALYYVYEGINLNEIKNMKNFYLRRLVTIMPMYWLVAFVYNMFVMGIEYFKESVLLIPAEALGIQMVFYSLFSFGHNGGTWFVSCMLLSYLIFPFLNNVVNQLAMRYRVTIICICILILDYAPWVVKYYGVGNIYSNPFFRGLEFFIGICLASVYMEIKEKPKLQWLFTVKSVVGEIVVLVGLVSMSVSVGWNVNDYMMYSLIALPCFGAMLLSLSGLDCAKIEKNKIVRYLSDLAYAFFLAQFFTWKLAKIIINMWGILNNILVIIITFIVCMIIAILLNAVFRRVSKSRM